MDYADNFYMTPAQQVDTEAKYMEYYLTRDNALDNMKKSITEGSQVTPIYYDYYQFASGKISRQELDSRLAKYRTNNYARDFADNVYHTRLLQQYNLALRNSSDVSSNNLVVNYKHDNAELINRNLLDTMLITVVALTHGLSLPTCLSIMRMDPSAKPITGSPVTNIGMSPMDSTTSAPTR